MSTELTTDGSVPTTDTRSGSSGHLADKAFRGLTQFFALLVALSVLGVFVTLLVGAWPALEKYGFFNFLTTNDWNPVTDVYGAVAPIYGTLVTSLLALLIGVPVSFGIALFITELAPVWLKRPIGVAIELLAAVPSIIYGMWGLFVFAPWFSENVQPWMTDNLGGWPLIGSLFQGPPMGIGMFTAGLILAIMIIPFMAAVMRDVFETVPPVYKESAYGLGGTTWEVVWKVVLPYTKIGVVGGVMLGLGRALGETMAVTFVIGNSHNVSGSLFMPGNTISSTLANEFTEAAGEIYTSSLISLGLVLFLLTFVVLAIAKVMLIRLKAKEGKAS
ncbi:phosphate ABC transporter permease subunit PstC [Marinobacter sp. R17]|uniref:phosphate ABC transporter permease subunit PstC n=1 Tax=Marinobacter sp. R17 TaxID=2484250 RepID=UPI000F4CFC95|nr:phosphate ABC transporter permease subunit PstC [Marinobacter sp. R17]